MAQYISKIKLGNTTYDIKDDVARSAISSSLVFKGVASSAATITGLTNYEVGWTYKASAAFTLTGVGIGKVEVGDMIICTNSRASYNAADWTIVQNNIDVFTGASNSTNGSSGLVPAPSAGGQLLFLRADGTWSSAVLEWGSF